MKRLLSLLLCLMLVFPAFASAEEEKVLNLLAWETYIDDDTIAAFTEETGIKVVYSPIETNDDMLLKVTQSGGDYDLVLGSDYALDILRTQGFLQKLDKEKLSNFENLDERFLNQPFDPESEYVVPYMAGSPLIVYDAAKVDFPITGYADLWDERLRDSVVIVDDARIVMGITLKTMGKSFNETDPAVLREAQQKLMPLYANIRAFDYSTPHMPMITGETSVGFMFTPFVFLALMERPDLTVAYPKEGLGFGVDGLVLVANAKHPDNAHLFLNYLMRPEVAAHNAMWQAYMCVNKAATPFLSEEYLNNPVVNVPQDLLAGAEYIEDIGETETLFQELYSGFKMQ